MRIILATQSILRGKALEILGLEYEQIPSNFDESSIRDEDLYERARKLAEAKANKVGKDNQEAIVIAGDLFAVVDGKVLEKPIDKDEAREMIRKVSGSEVEIIGGVAVSKGGKTLSEARGFKLNFREIKEYEIEDYISRYPVTKFSAAFEGDAMIRFGESMTGDYPYTLGFPMQSLIELLREQGLTV